jgi:hypothetical protein
MKSKILVVVGVLIVLMVSAYLYLDNRNRTLSPPGHAEVTTVDKLTISVDYSRPSVRDRVVFGTEEEDALQPYGHYWRLGANESTEMTINRDVTFNGQDLNAGTYKLYAIPGKDEFEIGVSTETGTWGYAEPDYDKDVLRTKVKATEGGLTEQFTIGFKETDFGAVMVFSFEQVRFAVKIEPRF